MMDLEEFLAELFHTGWYENEIERRCPLCSYYAEEHEVLVEHVMWAHPKHLITYSSDIDLMLNKPIDFFREEPMRGYMCIICGHLVFTPGEAREHFKIHREDIKQYKLQLRERAEESV